jgi:hypothetical protein
MKLGKLLWSILPLLIFGGVIFVGIGDRFLPPPLKTLSQIARQTMNQKLLEFLPKPKLKRPSEQRENQIEELIPD